MVCEEVRNNVVTGLQDNFAGNFTTFSSIGILIHVEKWVEMDLPADETAFAHEFLLLKEVDSFMLVSTMLLELFLGFEAFAALRAGHLECGLKHHIFVCVNLGLPCMVLTVLLLTSFMFSSLAVLLEQFLAFKAHKAGTTLELSLGNEFIIRAERLLTLALLLSIRGSTISTFFALLLDRILRFLNQLVDLSVPLIALTFLGGFSGPANCLGACI